ncbi:hypothetical protein KUT97_30730, partial [Pseudomonas aeruginosa]|nr:hypothetical protein [Pseudomonas aeruginosa]
LTFSKILDSFSSRSDFFYTLKCEEPEKLKPGLERDMERNGEYGALYRRAEFEKILGKLKL